MGAALLFGMFAAAAAAQAPAAPAVALANADNPDTIIVTGERTKRSLKETPSSVTVFERKDIERLAAPDRLQQLLQNVPNVLVPTSRDSPVIRGQAALGALGGLPAFLGGARPRTVLQVDGRTLTFSEFLNTPEGIWDVDHVEVFVSPQTTTQGVNSIGGAIFIHTADPTFTPQGRIRAIVGQSRRRQASAVVSEPLIGDQLAFRLSGDVYRSVSSTKMSGPVAGVSDINPDRYWTGRAKLLAEPRAIPGLRVLTTFVHSHSQAPQAELAQPPLRKRRDDSYVFGYIEANVDSVTSLVTYPIAQELESRTTFSRGWLHYRRLAPPGFGQNRIRGKDASFETILDWKPSGRVSAVGGIAYQRFDLDQFINLEAALLGKGTFKDKQPSAGVFGEVTWRATGGLSLTAGARYQSDGKRRTGTLTMSPPLPLDYDATTHAFLPKLSAAFDATDDVRFGVLVQRAYNPGGVTLDPAHQKQLEFRPEYMWDYELFTRATFLEKRLTVNANFFYEALKDAQRELDFDLNSPAGYVGLLQIINEPKAEADGAELSLVARPLQNLSVNAAVGLLKTKVIKGIAINDPFVDKGFFGAPELTANAGLAWEPVHDVHISSQVRRVAGFAGDNFGTAILRTKGFWIADGRASLDTKRFSLFVYGQNLFNTFRIIGWSGPTNIPDLNAELTDPREIGVGIEARF